MLRINKLVGLLVVGLSLLTSSCGTDYKSVYADTGQQFVTTNEPGQKLFFVTAPVGKWEVLDYTKKGTHDLEFDYMGPNQGMINSELRIKFITNLEERAKKELTDALTLRGLKDYIAKNLSDTSPPNGYFYRAENLIGEVRHIAGQRCAYFSYVKHVGPKLSSEKFGGMGAGEMNEYYECPVLRDGDIWYFLVDINYSLSDVAIQDGMNINFDKMVANFRGMLKPSLDSLKLYGDIKQH